MKKYQGALIIYIIDKNNMDNKPIIDMMRIVLKALCC